MRTFKKKSLSAVSMNTGVSLVFEDLSNFTLNILTQRANANTVVPRYCFCSACFFS